MTADLHEHSDPVGSQAQGCVSRAGLARRFSCDPSSIGAARRAVDELGGSLSPALLADLRLLVSELMANSVEHGPRREGRTIALGVSVSERRVRAEVQDGGRGFTPVASRPPAQAPSGRGLYVIDQLAASWGVSDADGTRVWFELDRERSEAAQDDLEPAVR